ncbi:MAG: GDYXXLXY domain-containing protein [Synechococcales bacterium]|nr:GDYXXLXY domain-containing protein [Synechococcales bacterium]
MSNLSDFSPRNPFRFWIPLALQTLLIAAVPAQAIYTHTTGKTVVIKTAPVDPYDLLRGYYTVLNYDISQVNTLKKLPGWKDLPKETWNKDFLDNGLVVYVTLERPQPKATAQATPDPWKPIAISPKRPDRLPDHQISLQGKVQHNQIIYGLETYYMPESRRDEVNNTIAHNQRMVNQRGANAKPAVVEIKVDAQGKAVPVQIWVADQRFEF